MLGHSRPRRSHQLRKVLMPRGDRQADALLVTDAEILRQFEQRQREPLLEPAIHEVRASQLHQVPAANVARRHALEIVRCDAQRNLDEGLQLDRPYLAFSDRLASKMISDSQYRRRYSRNHSGRYHDHQYALALAIATRD